MAAPQGTYHPIFEQDPYLGLNRAQFDNPVDYIAVILCSIAVLATLITSIIGIRRAIEKQTRLMTLTASYSTTAFLTIFFVMIWFAILTNYFTDFFVAVGMNIAMLVFLFAQTETSRLIRVDKKRIDTIIFRWNVLHVVMCLATATPYYMVDVLILADASQEAIDAVTNWAQIAPVWLAYGYIYDAANSIWITRKIYLVSRKIEKLHNASLKTVANNTISNLGRTDGSESRETNAITDHSVAEQPETKKDTTHYYYKSVVYICFMIFCDIMGIIFMTLYSLTLWYEPGTLEARIGFSYVGITAAFAGVHVVFANLLYGLIAEIFKSRTNRAHK